MCVQELGVTVKGHRVSLGDHENALRLIVEMDVQLCIILNVTELYTVNV